MYDVRIQDHKSIMIVKSDLNITNLIRCRDESSVSSRRQNDFGGDDDDIVRPSEVAEDRGAQTPRSLVTPASTRRHTLIAVIRSRSLASLSSSPDKSKSMSSISYEHEKAERQVGVSE